LTDVTDSEKKAIQDILSSSKACIAVELPFEPEIFKPSPGKRNDEYASQHVAQLIQSSGPPISESSYHPAHNYGRRTLLHGQHHNNIAMAPYMVGTQRLQLEAPFKAYHQMQPLPVITSMSVDSTGGSTAMTTMNMMPQPNTVATQVNHGMEHREQQAHHHYPVPYTYGPGGHFMPMHAPPFSGSPHVYPHYLPISYVPYLVQSPQSQPQAYNVSPCGLEEEQQIVESEESSQDVPIKKDDEQCQYEDPPEQEQEFKPDSSEGPDSTNEPLAEEKPICDSNSTAATNGEKEAEMKMTEEAVPEPKAIVVTKEEKPLQTVAAVAPSPSSVPKVSWAGLFKTQAQAGGSSSVFPQSFPALKEKGKPEPENPKPEKAKSRNNKDLKMKN